MYTLINEQDMTPYINYNRLDVEQILKDPQSVARIVVNDNNSAFAIASMNPVVIIDENGVSNPTKNILLDPLMNTHFLAGNVFSQPPPINNANGMYTSQTATSIAVGPPTVFNASGTGSDTWIYQGTQPGFVVPGQSYMLSAYMQITGVMSNASAFLELDFWDQTGPGGPGSSGPALLLRVKQTYTSIGSRTRMNISGLAPAGTAFITVAVGVTVTNSTNSGQVTVDTLQLEPMYFTRQGVSYPTPDCNLSQLNCRALPDTTVVRQTRIFAGYVNKTKRSYDEPGRVHDVQVANYADLLETTNINQAYPASTFDSVIIQDILTNHFQYVLTGNNVVQTSPQTQAIYPDMSVKDVLNNFCSGNGNSYFVDPYLDLNYTPTYYSPAAFNITDSNNPDGVINLSAQNYTYTEDFTQKCNAAKVTGALYKAGPQTDNFTANGTVTSYNLTFAPDTITAFTVGGVTKTVGWKGTDTFTNRFALVDKVAQQLLSNGAYANGTAVSITYYYQTPVSVQELHLASMQRFGRQFDRVINNTNITNQSDASLRAIGEVLEYAAPRVIIEFKINKLISQGQIVKITSVKDNLNATPFLVQAVKTSYLGNGINQYQVTAGAYNPDILQYIKFINQGATASQVNTAIAPQQIDLAASDVVSYTDSINAPTVNGARIHVHYGGSNAIWGFCQWS